MKPFEYGITPKFTARLLSVVDPDPELYPGSGIICSESGKNEEADYNFVFNLSLWILDRTGTVL